MLSKKKTTGACGHCLGDEKAIRDEKYADLEIVYTSGQNHADLETVYTSDEKHADLEIVYTSDQNHVDLEIVYTSGQNMPTSKLFTLLMKFGRKI